MSTELQEALKKMRLYDGQVMQFQVNGWRVELRVEEERAAAPPGLPLAVPPSEEDLQNVMITPPFDFPVPTGGVPCHVERGPLPPLDVPHIPPADEGAA